jgi:hypothetical protein
VKESGHLAGDPDGDEGEQFEVAVSQGLEQPGGPHGPAGRAAEPLLPAATTTRPREMRNRGQERIRAGWGRWVTSGARGGSGRRRNGARST